MEIQTEIQVTPRLGGTEPLSPTNEITTKHSLILLSPCNSTENAEKAEILRPRKKSKTRKNQSLEGTPSDMPKKKKSSKKKKGGSGSETPKFGLETKQVSQRELKDLDYNTITIKERQETSPRPEKKGREKNNLSISITEKITGDYSVMFDEIEIFAYLKDKKIPMASKIFYIAVCLMFIATYPINIAELIKYIQSDCPTSYSSAGLYFNFIMLLGARFGVLSWFTSEVNGNLLFNLKIPFIVPVICTGVIANFQLPVVIVDYGSCHWRSPLLEPYFGFFIVDAIAIAAILGFLGVFLVVIFTSKFKVSRSFKEASKVLLYFIGISVVFALNVIFFIVTFGQFNEFSLSLCIDNLLYWTLVVAGGILFLIQKKEVPEDLKTGIEAVKTADEGIKPQTQITETKDIENGQKKVLIVLNDFKTISEEPTQVESSATKSPSRFFN